MFTVRYLLLTFLVATLRGEYFTAIVDIARTIKNEEKILSEISSYLNEEIEKMTKIKGMLAEINNSRAVSKDEAYFSNPINVYRELNDLVLDKKPKLQKLLKLDDNEGAAMEPKINSSVMDSEGSTKKMRDERLEEIKKMIENLPDYDDLKGSMEGLFRLQDVYKLDVALLAKGLGLGKTKNSGLSAYQCFGLGYYAHLNSDFYHASLWLNEAYEIQRNDHSSQKEHKIPTSSILEYLAHSLYKQGKIQAAYAMNNAIIAIEPTNDQALKNKEHFEAIIDFEKKAGQRRVGERMESSMDYLVNNQMISDILQMNYEALCRGENLKNPLKRPSLVCKLVTKIPLFVYAPLKVEILWDKPLIMMYHGVISDEEISHFKQTAGPMLKRATVQNSITGRMEPAEYRISKSTWLEDDHDQITRRLRARIEVMTGLDLATSEQFQIGNYGIGGQYEPHYDHATDNEDNFFEEYMGNRIATLMFYMSDIEAGGDTVFTEVNVKVTPVKNSAVFWWNLLPSGRSDDRTRHAACPVLLGSKWVMNKWIHDRGQEFRRPCSLAEY